MAADILLEYTDWARECLTLRGRDLTPSQQDGLVIDVAASEVLVHLRYGERRLSHGEIENLALLINTGENVVIRFQSDAFLQRELSTQRLPFRRSLEIANIDIHDNFPFLIENSILMFSHNKCGGTDYYILKKDVTTGLFKQLKSQNVNISRFEMCGVEGDSVVTTASARYFSTSHRQRGGSKLVKFAALIIAISLIATYLHMYFRLSNAQNQIDIQLQESHNQALLLRKRTDAYRENLKLLEAARAAKFDAVSTSRIWDELTRILPDTTWITELTIHENVVQITGFSEESAALIGIIGASSIFSQPRFTGAVMRAVGQKGDRFSLQMEMSRHD